MAICPACGGSRVRSGYRPVAFPLRILGIRELLCDDCNYLYRAFSPLPPKTPHRRRQERKADAFAPGGKIDLASLNSDKRARSSESTPSLTIKIPPAVDPKAGARTPSRSSLHRCPDCGSDDTKRRRRRSWERLLFAVSNKRPFLCNSCDFSFYDRQSRAPD
jgi:hypothetical protein